MPNAKKVLREQTSIGIARPRAKQAQIIADHYGVSTAAFLENCIREHWKAIGRGDEPPPGFHFTPVRLTDADTKLPAKYHRQVSFIAEGLPQLVLTIEQARNLVSGLRRVIETGGRLAMRVGLPGSPAFVVFARQGRGFALLISDEGALLVSDEMALHARGLTPGLAADLAQAFEHAADRAEALP